MTVRTDSFSRSGAGLTWRVKTLLLLASLTMAAFVLVLTLGTDLLNQYQDTGELVLDILDEPVLVQRDSNGVPYIRANSRRDMLRAQGFVVAQDRLFQLEMYRAQIWGRLSRYLGKKTIALDTAMRVYGLGRAAQKHSSVLSQESRQYLQDYVDGLNAYITNRSDSHPIELALVGIEPTPWTLTDAIATWYFINHETSANKDSEIISQALIEHLGIVRASQIFPVNVNPLRRVPVRPVVAGRTDDPISLNARGSTLVRASSQSNQPLLSPPISFGSNAWAVAPRKSAHGRAVLANDPHLDVRILPGVWYPIGLSYPGFQAVGAALPAIPGLVIGRNDKVAWSLSNGYGDTQDLYIETQDPNNPDNYLEGKRSIPFDRIVEIIQVKDQPDLTITIRSTRRGPVISDHGLAAESEQLISHRWSVAQQFSPDLGLDQLMFARSARQADLAIQKIKLFTSNIVFADVDGNIGFRASGLVPIRANRDGSRPQIVSSSKDHWSGWIPAHEMPGEFNPDRGWVATANQDVRPDDYPYYYSSYFSPAYRFDRIAQLLGSEKSIQPGDHWKFQVDILNLHARRIVPILVPLLEQSGHKGLARQLRVWDHRDHADQAAPLRYQALYNQIARETFTDELGDALAGLFFDTRYYWIERFDQMLQTGNSQWFDDVATNGKVETLLNLVDRAATQVTDSLAQRYGSDATWGDAHRVTFVSPLRLSGTGAAALGGGEHAMSGSNETLLRSTYRLDEAFKTRSIDSARLVIDLGDSRKMAGVIPGGQTARQFHSNQQSQLSAWRAGLLNSWWLGYPPESAGQVVSMRLKPG